MKKITIYGRSDDLVYVEGDVYGCNEYNAPFDKPVLYVELGLLGDVFKVEYTKEGVWKVEQHKRGALKATNGKITKEPHGDSDSENYTDRVTVEGCFDYVEVWENYPPSEEELKRKLADELTEDDEQFDPSGYLTREQLGDIWLMVRAAKLKEFDSNNQK